MGGEAHQPWTIVSVSVCVRQRRTEQKEHAVMRTRIIRIGRSQGICLPKKLLAQSGLVPEVELIVQDQQIMIRGARHPRHTWPEPTLLANSS